MKAFLVDLENKPGVLARITEAIGAKGINITSLSGATCGTSGRVALMTADEAATRTTLGEIGSKFTETDAVEASMRNEPGSFGRTARRLADAGINIEAVFPTGMSGNDVMVTFLTDNPTKAREILATSTTGARR